MDGRDLDAGRDGHEHDVVMPGFRFHPTEEELVEFYLRRKVEGKGFNVELIAYLDLYRYDPWELPAFATIGEKEWFFYVPRDRKYRNGDRPNRVTTSGYWKATGADRMIRTERSRPIGLKKTLVFYSGKAPKGVRTGWIMNEYRLPHNDTDWSQRSEISLCRVYKRAGVEDRYHLPGTLSSRPSSSSQETCSAAKRQNTGAHQPLESIQSLNGHSSSSNMEEKLQGGGGAANVPAVLHESKAYGTTEDLVAPLSSTLTTEADAAPLQDSKNHTSHLVLPTHRLLTSFSSSMPAATVDELRRMVGYHQNYAIQTNQVHFPPPSQPQLPFTSLPLPNSFTTFTDHKQLWEWNPLPEAEINYAAFIK